MKVSQDPSSMSNAAPDTQRPITSHRSHPSALSPPRPLQVVQNAVARGNVQPPAFGRSPHTVTSFTPRSVANANGGGALGKIALDYSASSPASSAQGTPTRQEPTAASTPATLKRSLEVMTIDSDEEVRFQGFGIHPNRYAFRNLPQKPPSLPPSAPKGLRTRR